jgi:hypothetical protein
LPPPQPASASSMATPAAPHNPAFFITAIEYRRRMHLIVQEVIASRE